ncbi:uncharacterized protein LOC119033760 isoform X2 [Acanthopagrus latus]|uniref:uncharacterized protein LOC119033760 isoform X2 n=1 Tax=Acanthopagrus latus TaxID=8177 RepID=UPI00187C9F44|nr:uncharacterized protein LOC119033760 isoform X2 [Acanthopagrus latus]
MEGAGGHSTDRTTGLGSTSRASSSISESTLSSGSSTTSDVASKLVSVTVGRAADNLDELRQCISRWEAEGHSDTEDHWASHTQQKVKQHLHTFFNLRQVFAEHQGDATEDILEDLQHLNKSVKANDKSPHRMHKKICKGFKSVCQCFSISHPKTKVTDEQVLGMAAGSQSSSSTLDSTLHGSSPTASLQAAEPCIVMSPIMEEDLVTDMDLTPAPLGQDGHLEPSEVHVDEVTGSAGSGSYLKKSLKADKKLRQRMHKKICRGFKLACQWFSISQPKAKVTDKQGLYVVEGSQSSSSTLDSTLHGSSPSGSLRSFQAVESCVVMSAVEEEDLVTDMDLTPAPLGQDGHLEPSEVHVDEVVGSASSGSYLKQSVKADKKSSRRTDKKICKGFKSACQCFSISHPKTKVTDEQGLDVVEGSQSSSLTSDSTLHASSPTASLQAVEPCVVISPIMEEDLVTDMDLTPAPLGQDGHLEPSEVQVDEVVGSASSGSYLKQSVKADKKLSQRMDKKICKGFKSVCQCFSISHLEPTEIDVGAEQNVDENVDTASSVPTSHSASTRRLSTTVSISASEDTMTAEKAVTDIDATLGPSMVLSGAGHLDEVDWSASSSSLKNSLRANKKSFGRIGKKIIKGFKCAWQCFSISHPKTKVTDEQGLDVAEGSESYSTCDPTFHELSPTASLQAAEHCDVTCPVTQQELVLDMDSTPAPLGQDGHLEPSEVHVDEVVGSASSGSYLKKSLNANEKSPRRMDNKICKGFKSACQCFSMRHLEPEVHVGAEQNVEENVETATNNLTSGLAPPRELCNTFSNRSSEDTWTAEKAEQVTGMTKGTTAIMASPAPGHVYEVFGSSSTDANLPKPGSPSPPVKDRNQIMCVDSTSRHSGPDRHLEDSQDDKSAVDVIVTGFIDSLTKEQRKEMSRGVYSVDVQKKMSDSFAKGTKVLIKELDAELSASLQRSASQNSSVHTRSSTSSQLCGNEALAWELLSRFTKELDVTDERMRQILNHSGGKAPCDVAAAKTPVSMSSRIIKDTQSTEAVKLILSEPSDQKQRTPETETTRVPKKKSSWWCVCMKKIVDPLPSGRQGNGSGCVELPPVREAWTEVKKNDEAQDKPAQTKQASLLKKLQSCFSTSRFSPVSLKDLGDGSGCVELPPVREAWTEVKMNDEAQDKPAQTKQASLLKKFLSCFSTSRFSPVSLKDLGDGSGCVELPPVREAWTEIFTSFSEGLGRWFRLRRTPAREGSLDRGQEE